ncbi:hypothetical protein [Luteolibacter sp. LG18]|nr:hypothetical protein llg_22640 [Luteolibacter sp. LG18]
MKSCFGMLLVVLVILAVLGSAGLVWYLNANTEFSRKELPAAAPARAE